MTCFDCVYAKVLKGYSGSYWQPPEPDEAECTNPDVPEEIFEDSDDFDSISFKCGHFSPIIAGPCGNCKKPIEQARHEWKIWGAGYESVPCCSEKCKREYEAKFDEYERRMNEHIE